MYNYNKSNYSAPTVLGIPEKWERVLCYAGVWVTGILFLLIEHRNQTVRRHAAQSTVIFGVLGILGFLASALGGLLGHVWVIGWLFGLGFGLISALIGIVAFAAWILLMLLAYAGPKTFISGPRYERYM